ncbi:MAG TPA: hypothetical protein VL991_03305 [Terracidiphilus sp.]|nr:hypothetical protein [Terracidiphilus sp.]
MQFPAQATRTRRRMLSCFAVAALAASVAASAQGFGHGNDYDHDADGHGTVFTPGNLVVSRSVYFGNADTVKVGEILPPGCGQGLCSPSTGAVADGTYPYVFNNDSYDGSFGITSPIFLDEMTPWGWTLRSLEVPNSTQWGVTKESNQLVTSFSSKSEEALHLSSDGKYLTFMDYVAPVNMIDASNANTPGAVDPTNPVGENVYRAVATVDKHGNFTFTETNAYSGNNGRAAILYNTDGANVFYTAGNAGNGANPQPDGVILGAGAQIITPSTVSEYQQNPGTPTPVASFSVTELADKADKVGKDDNFRGMTVFNNVLYFTKGSGGNGVNTVYFVDTTGTACPKGVGLPVAGAKLPTTPLTYNLSTLQTSGLPSNMCVLAGFPTLSNKVGNPVNFPFGLWFADANTLYVADEGDGTTTYDATTNTYTDAAGQTLAGLEKWVFNATTKTWNLAYTLQNGLSLGKPYTVWGYPTGNNAATGLPWAPATDGLRNVIGTFGDGRFVSHDKVVIYAISSTVSGNGDQGADPNKLYVIVDDLKNTSAAGAAGEKFYELRTARAREVLRGVAFTPGTEMVGSY